MPARHPVLTRCAVTVAVFASLSTAALAADYDPAAAQVLAGPCASCHGPDGRSPGAIPSIAGQPEADLRAKLSAYHAGTDPQATVMTRLLKGYDETQIAALARWFSEIEQ